MLLGIKPRKLVDSHKLLIETVLAKEKATCQPELPTETSESGKEEVSAQFYSPPVGLYLQRGCNFTVLLETVQTEEKLPMPPCQTSVLKSCLVAL